MLLYRGSCWRLVNEWCRWRRWRQEQRAQRQWRQERLVFFQKISPALDTAVSLFTSSREERLRWVVYLAIETPHSAPLGLRHCVVHAEAPAVQGASCQGPPAANQAGVGRGEGAAPPRLEGARAARACVLLGAAPPAPVALAAPLRTPRQSAAAALPFPAPPPCLEPKWLQINTYTSSPRLAGTWLSQRCDMPRCRHCTRIPNIPHHASIGVAVSFQLHAPPPFVANLTRAS